MTLGYWLFIGEKKIEPSLLSYTQINSKWIENCMPFGGKVVLGFELRASGLRGSALPLKTLYQPKNFK
jgi:hypothetical protein